MTRAFHSSATRYLNVDFDIDSRRDLRPLVKGFGVKVNVLYVGRACGKYCAHLEIAQHTKTATADSTIRAFCRLIEGLPEPKRLLWNNATVRSFSVGIQAGTDPSSCDFTIRPETVKAVSEVAAQIVLTVYAPE
ncbi:MAG: hypothetical protein ABSH31_09965 [Bryobacteraceae bacterium]